MKLTIKLLCILVLFSSFGFSPKEEKYDLVVYGGTSSGVIAAYAASKQGLKVAILEPRAHVGGLTTGGLGHVDVGNIETIGGYAREFLKRAGEYYGMNKLHTEIESSVAEKIFLQMLGETDVKVFYNSRLLEKNGVIKKSNKIQTIILESGRKFNAKVFIDATYEGDLMAQSKVSYTVGREAIKEYNESSAGIQRYKLARRYNADQMKEIRKLSDQFPLDFMYYEKENAGDADHRVQAYCYRLCVTTDKENQIPFMKPENYNPERYSNILRWIERLNSKTLDKVVTLYPLENEKFDVNHMDHLNASWKYPDGSYKERQYIENYHKEYQQGWLYFLANDKKVSEELRNDTRRYGYARDEFADNGNWPYTLYIREGRRMKGQYIMKQHDAWDNPYKEDAIGIGSYFMDCHGVQRFITPEGEMYDEGEMEFAPFKPYEISYGTIVPKQKECENLFVTICMSASHTIYGSLRMEPVFMMTGHAAGVASALAFKGDVAVQKINIEDLQEKLRSQGQILSHTPRQGFYIPKKSVSGYVMDDSDAVLKGHWAHSVGAVPFLEYNYRYISQSATETAYAEYSPVLPEDGLYEAQIMYSPDRNRSKAVRVVIKDNEGKKNVYVDMTKGCTATDNWFSIGTYEFSKAKKPKVIISNQGNGGLVIADGVRFIKK